MMYISVVRKYFRCRRRIIGDTTIDDNNILKNVTYAKMSSVTFLCIWILSPL